MAEFLQLAELILLGQARTDADLERVPDGEAGAALVGLGLAGVTAAGSSAG